MAVAAPPDRSFHHLDPRSAPVRFLGSIALGVLVALFVPYGSTTERFVAGWDAGAFVLLVLSWHLIWTCDAPVTRHRAASSDPGRSVVWVLVVVGCLCSLFAATVALRPAKHLEGSALVLLVGICQCAVVTAWLLIHTSFTLRYAHLFYRDDAEGVGGITFPGDRDPDYFDFAYLAFTVGMCFQVSDVSISSRQIRRTVLVHATLSFAYNTAILALALSLISQLIG